MLLPVISALLYTLGAFLYYLHQHTIIYFVSSSEGEDIEYNEYKVLLYAIIWPFQVIEIIVKLFLFSEENDK